MELLNTKTVKFVFLPGGAILLTAVLLLDSGWLPLSASSVTFFYYAVFVAAAFLAWRFHYTRILFSVIVLVLAHHALVFFFAQGRTVSSGPGQVAFEAVALLVPLNFIFLTFFPEKHSEGRILFWFLSLLFFESVFVAIVCRPNQPDPTFLHFSLNPAYHSRVPQPALVFLVAALGLLAVRMVQHRRTTESGMFWSLTAVWLGLQSGGIGVKGTAYFGIAGLALASSIIENSYSLAYQDELTRLPSRRAFNDALLRLKHPYTIAAVDIDHFKSVNDTYGHDTGDHVLRLVGSRLDRVSGGGQAFRVGGEEFTVLYPNRGAKDVADHLELLRMDIESASFRLRSGKERRKQSRTTDRRAPGARRTVPRQPTDAQSLSVTVSIGLAESQPKKEVEDVIEQADKALYRAKQGGRNRIEIASIQPKRARGVKLKRTEPS